MTEPDREFLTAWLRRIGLDSLPPATADGLAQLVQAQQEAIPFENVTVLCGSVPRLDRAALAAKLLSRSRGGYCLELNSLLAHGLEMAGFSVRHVLARVLWKRGTPGPRTHHFLEVDVDDQRWMVDAGFGGPGLTAPMPRAAGAAMTRHGVTYRLSPDGHNGLVLSRETGSNPAAPLYSATAEPVGATDLDAANWLAATWPGSPFVSRLVAARYGAEGRVTLENTVLARHRHGGDPERIELGSGTRILDCLQTDFEIALDPDERATLLNRLRQITG